MIKNKDLRWKFIDNQLKREDYEKLDKETLVWLCNERRKRDKYITNKFADVGQGMIKIMIFIISIMALVLIIFSIFGVAGATTPKEAVCGALNLTEPNCTIWFDNSNLSDFIYNCTYNITINYNITYANVTQNVTYQNITTYDYRNITTYENITQNITHNYYNSSSLDVYTKSQIDTRFNDYLTTSSFDTQKANLTTTTNTTVGISIWWKIIIIGMLLAIIYLFYVIMIRS